MKVRQKPAKAGSSGQKNRRGKLELLWKHNVLVLSVILIITFLVYSPVFNFELNKLDDDYQVTNNEHIRELSLENLAIIFSSYYVGMYQPIPTLSYAIEYSLFGLNPGLFHGTNLFLHLLNILLLFWLLKLLLKEKTLVFITTILFAVHPMFVEVVAWVSARSTLVFSGFFFLSLIFYTKYLDGGNNAKFFLLSFVFFVLAMFSKAMAMTLPALLIIFDYLRSRKFNTRLLLEKIPYFAVAIVFGIVSIYARIADGQANQRIDFSLAERLVVSGYQTIWYAIKLIAPFRLTVYIPTPATLDWKFYISPILLIGIAFLLYTRAKKNRILIFGILFFIIGISVVLNIFADFGSITHNRYTYTTYPGLFIIMALGLHEWILRKPRFKPAAVMLVVFFSVYLVVLSGNRLKVWKDDFSIWDDVIQKNENVQLAYCNRGNAWQERMEYERAIADYNRAVELKPEDYDSYYNRGTCRLNLKDPSMAIRDFDTAIYINSHMSEAYSNRGRAKMELGDYKDAILDFDKAIEIKPDLFPAYTNRGLAEINQGNFERALKDFDRSIAIKPTYGAYSGRGRAKEGMGDFNGALEDYNKSIEIKPFGLTFALRGLAKMKMTDYDGAVSEFNKALQLNPGDSVSMRNKQLALFLSGNKGEQAENQAKYYYNLGCKSGDNGDMTKALEFFTKAIELDPEMAIAYENRAIVYFSLGKIGEAKNDVQKAGELGKEINPGFLEALESASPK